jgi:hypothetical protein
VEGDHPVGTVVWVVATIATDAVSNFGGAMGAAVFGAANVVVGVLLYQGFALLVRRMRASTNPAATLKKD